MKDPESIHQLLLRHVDRQLRPEEEIQVAELLRSNPEARAFLRELSEQAVMVAELERTEHARQSEVETRTALPHGRREPGVGMGLPRVPFTRRQWLATAAAMVALATIVYLLWPHSQRNIVRITGLNGSLQWTGNGGQVVGDLQVGSSLGGGTLESLSTESWAEFEFRDRSRATISGHSMLTVSEQDQKELHLREGNLSADVAPQSEGKPMVIYTPTAKLDVLGTQFNVEAQPSVTVVTVNEGQVRVTRLADGSVKEVPAEHQAVASASPDTEFKMKRRPGPVDSWQSSLPADSSFGNWLPATGGLQAAPMLLKWHPEKPKSLYVIILSVSSGDSRPVLLSSGSQFRICGRLKTAQYVGIGLTLYHPKGGFAGKHVAKRKIEPSQAPGEFFDIIVPLQEFKSDKIKFGDSPIGLELAEWWCMTVNEDVGLEISQVELQPPNRKQQHP